MNIFWVPLLFMILGALTYGFTAKDSKPSEIGRLVFFGGAMAMALAYAGTALHLR